MVSFNIFESGFPNDSYRSVDNKPLSFCVTISCCNRVIAHQVRYAPISIILWSLKQVVFCEVCIKI